MYYHNSFILTRVLEDTYLLTAETFIDFKAGIVPEKERYIVTVSNYIKLQIAAKDYTHE